MLLRNLRPSFVLCQIEEEVAVGFLCRVHVSVIQTYTIFGVHLTGQVHELFLISDVFQCHYIMSIQGDVPTEPALMKQNKITVIFL